MVMKRRSIAIVAALFLALTVSSSVEATLATLSVSARAVPKSASQAGGSVSLRVTVTNATECVFASTPTVVGFNGRTKCTKGTFNRSGKLGKNSGKARTIRLKVTVSNAVALLLAQGTIKQSGKSATPVKVSPTKTTIPKPVTTTTTTTSTTTTTTVAPTTTTTTIPLPIVGLNCTNICGYALSGGNVIFSWTPIPGAGQYGVQVFFSGGFPNIGVAIEPGYPPPLWVQNGQDYVEINFFTGVTGLGGLCDNAGVYEACPVGTMVSFEVEGAPAAGGQSTPFSVMSNTVAIK
jgi:hypothetical protein